MALPTFNMRPHSEYNRKTDMQTLWSALENATSSQRNKRHSIAQTELTKTVSVRLSS
jgi:hypothetical protein